MAKKIKLIIAVAASLVLALYALTGCSSSGDDTGKGENSADFVIENGVLKEYKGESVNVVIPDGVTIIDTTTFQSNFDIKSVTIPEGVTTIDNLAFWACRELESVSIPSSVTTIGDWAFNTCGKLTSITIPEGVTTIGNRAFAYCNSLKSVSIPSSVTTIGDSAFQGCSSLESITIPQSVAFLGDRAFYECSGLKTIYCEARRQPSAWKGYWREDVSATIILGDKEPIDKNPDFVIVNDELMEYKGASVEIRIPYGITSIADFAFSGCENLQSVIVPETVIFVRENSFAGSDNLKHIYCEAEEQPAGWDSKWSAGLDFDAWWGYSED